eukprot:1601979-Amphidinium_carterae.1
MCIRDRPSFCVSGGLKRVVKSKRGSNPSQHADREDNEPVSLSGWCVGIEGTSEAGVLAHTQCVAITLRVQYDIAQCNVGSNTKSSDSVHNGEKILKRVCVISPASQLD